MPIVRSVWIEETCIICHSCSSAAPDVFDTDGAYAAIRGDARADCITSMNGERSALITTAIDQQEAIIEAAAGCPVEAIQLVLE